MPMEKHVSQPNIVVILSDTLRAADLGCYGSREVHTPAIDAFAQQSLRFTRAYPESLPTIPVRRALHTGRRAYPFRHYQPLKWDIVYLPGWQAISNDEDTLAENLAAAGYQTGFVTDTLPYFAPGFSFTRGFWQWEFVRGQQQDRWKSPFSLGEDHIRRYQPLEEFQQDPHNLVPMHLANTAHVKTEEDTSTARVFEWGMQFLQDNLTGQPFYLLIDCFDPHEPWEAPQSYYRQYGDPHYQGRKIVHCGYGPAGKFGYTAEEIHYVQAQYRGLVSLVDTWFGKFMQKLEALNLAEDTVVFLLSDHGTNFCQNPRQIIGKPEDSLYPGVMHLPFLVRTGKAILPGPSGGKTDSSLIYNLDLTRTIYDLAGLSSGMSLDGQSLLPLLSGKGEWKARPYVTCRYGHSLCYIDDQTWAIGSIDGVPLELFDLESDPECQVNILEKAGDRWNLAWKRLLEDAGGAFPDYRELKRTDAIGEKPR